MKVFVIGGSGFTGRHLLAAAPASREIGALARSAEAATVVEGLGAEALHGDLDDKGSISAALEAWSPELVVCVASLGFGHAPALVEALETAGVNRAVFTSTTSIFTRLNPASKNVRLAAEEAITRSSLSYTILRPTMIYGAPGDRNMERLLWKLVAVPLIPAPGLGKHLLQPIHVDDLAAALIAAATEPGAVGQAVNVAGPDPISFAEVVAEAGRALNRPSRVLPLPASLLRAAVGVQAKVLPRPRITTEQINRLLEDKVFDIGPARALLGFRPRPFRDGIADEAKAVLSGGTG